MEQPAPAPAVRQPGHDQDGDEDRDGLGDRDGELPDGDRDQCDDVADVVADALVGPLGQLDEDGEGDDDQPPHRHADDVAGMAVVALAGRDVVEPDG
jgi:hypothetical protein